MNAGIVPVFFRRGFREMDILDLQKLLTLLVEKHPWPVVSTFLVGLVVRLMKSDTKIPIDIPSRYRIWSALGVALVLATLGHFAFEKAPWGTALAEGLVTWILAVLGHNVVIDSLRGGKEIPIPYLTKPGVPPSPGKPPSIPPGPPTGATGIPNITNTLLVLTFCGAIGWSVGACATLKPLAKPALDIACVLAYAHLDAKEVKQVCSVVDEYMPQVLDLIAAERKAGVMKAAMSKPDAGVVGASSACASDAGAAKPDH